MARRGFRTSTTGLLNRAVRVSAELTILNTMSQVLNTVPNVPAPVKVIAGVSAQVQTYRIIASVLKTQSGPIKTIGTAFLAMYETLATVQQLPNIIASLQQLGGATAGTPLLTQ